MHLWLADVEGGARSWLACPPPADWPGWGSYIDAGQHRSDFYQCRFVLFSLGCQDFKHHKSEETLPSHCWGSFIMDIWDMSISHCLTFILMLAASFKAHCCYAEFLMKPCWNLTHTHTVSWNIILSGRSNRANTHWCCTYFFWASELQIILTSVQGLSHVTCACLKNLKQNEVSISKRNPVHSFKLSGSLCCYFTLRAAGGAMCLYVWAHSCRNRRSAAVWDPAELWRSWLRQQVRLQVIFCSLW